MVAFDAKDSAALIDACEIMTYGQLCMAGDNLAHKLDERSVVFVVATNTIPCVIGYVGFLRAKVVLAMIRPETNENQFRSMLEAYRPQGIWAPREYLPQLLGDYIVAYEDRGYVLRTTSYPTYKVDQSLALLITTSGSTGTPKFVRLSYDNVRSNAESIAEYQHITGQDRAITTLPFSYTYGISIVNSHLLMGASVVMTECSILDRSFWELLKEENATNFGGVPYTYQMLERLHFEDMNVPSLRFLSQAGGRLGERLQRLFGEVCQRKGIDFMVMYGQTEATARMSWLPPSETLYKLGSIGIAIPGGNFELMDADGQSISGADVAGELVYQGPNVSLGYATCAEDLALGDQNQGVLHTGDVAKRDTDGYYYIVGRLKRFLKMYGNRVNLDELESIFGQRGYELACVGSDDHMVVFTTTRGSEALRMEISTFTKIHPRAFEIRTIAEIPHMATGKVDYACLEHMC